MFFLSFIKCTIYYYAKYREWIYLLLVERLRFHLTLNLPKTRASENAAKLIHWEFVSKRVTSELNLCECILYMMTTVRHSCISVCFVLISPYGCAAESTQLNKDMCTQRILKRLSPYTLAKIQLVTCLLRLSQWMSFVAVLDALPKTIFEDFHIFRIQNKIACNNWLRSIEQKSSRRHYRQRYNR